MTPSTTKLGTLLGLILLGTIGSDCRAQSPDPMTLLRGVEMARLKTPPSRLHLHLVFRSESRTNESDQIMEFEGDKRRSVNPAPKRGAAASLCYDGSQVCLYSPSIKQASLRDIRDDTADALFDPRILGLSAGLGWGSTVSRALPYNKGKVEMIGREPVHGRDAWHIRISVANPDQYQVDLWVGDTDRFPVYRYDMITGPVRYSVTSVYDNQSYPWLPSKTDSSYTNGALHGGLTVTVKEAEAHVAFSETNWTLAGLQLPVGTQVIDRRTSLTVGVWNGTNVTPFEVLAAAQHARSEQAAAVVAKSRESELATLAKELPWVADLPKALEQAKSHNRIVLLDFTGSDWCVWCGKFDRDILSKPAFAAYAATNLTMVLLDFPIANKQRDEVAKRNEELKAKFKVEGFPAFVVLDADGKEIGRQVGYLAGGPEAFIAELERFKKQ